MTEILNLDTNRYHKASNSSIKETEQTIANSLKHPTPESDVTTKKHHFPEKTMKLKHLDIYARMCGGQGATSYYLQNSGLKD